MDLERIRHRYVGNEAKEWDRLCSTPITRIEYIITSHSLDKYLPESGLILDAGSGPGRYTIELGERGYQVVMFDLVHEMLHLGHQKVFEAGIVGQTFLVEGDIADLPFDDEVFDAVISLGAPISHLTDSQTRLKAIINFSRVVKPGGWVLITGTSRLAFYRGAVYWHKENPEFLDRFRISDDRQRGIFDGSHVWYNFAPGELESLMQTVGLHIIDRIGCEGLANHLPMENLEEIEADPHYWPVWKEILLETCNEPSIIGISNHLMVVARK